MSMSSPSITIITPSYNQAAYLEATIRSVLDQAYANLEYIIIDGGSTDGSIDIIRRYNDRLAYWVSEPDSGQVSAINKGLRHAHGEILAWLNSDDTYRPGAIAAAVRYLSEYPEVDVVYGDVEFSDAAGQPLGTMSAWDYSVQQQVCATNLVPQPAAFFRCQALERVGGCLNERLHLAFDYELWVRMGLAGLRFAHVAEVWATYRLHAASKTETRALDFTEEVRQVVDWAFTEGGAPLAWHAAAESNLEQLVAETHLRLGQVALARRHFLRAIQRYPLRPKTVALIAFAIDRRLGLAVRRLRWRLAGRRDDPWQMMRR